MDMEKNTHTKYEIRADNPDPTKAEEWAIFATDYNCHARRIACTTNKAEADAMLRGLSGDDSDLLAALEYWVKEWDDGCQCQECGPCRARAAIAKARGQ